MTNSSGDHLARPLLQSEIEAAQANTKSGKQAARWLNVHYRTYRKYAQMYGLFERHINRKGIGVSRPKKKGLYGLEDILAGKHPTYNKSKLKLRLIAAGYLKDECAMCGYAVRRVIDGRIPLVLHQLDGNPINFALDNLQLRCYNCTYQTTGIISVTESRLDPGVFEGDQMARGELSEDDIAQIQAEFMRHSSE